jgi:hypothetical protein
MASAVVITYPGNCPDPDAPVYINKIATIAARSSLRFWGDSDKPTSLVIDGSGNISRWNDRRGNGRYYEQTDPTKRPARKTGAGAGAPPLDRPYALFNGTDGKFVPDGDMPLLNPAQAFSIAAFVRPAIYDENNYLTGSADPNDNIILRSGPNNGGSIAFLMGDTTLAIAHTVDTWTPVLATWNGSTSKRMRLFVGGTMVQATATTAPTTPRALSMGATSAQASQGTWAGGIADWLPFIAEDVSEDTAFLAVLSGHVRSKYSLGYEPYLVA